MTKIYSTGPVHIEVNGVHIEGATLKLTGPIAQDGEQPEMLLGYPIQWVEDATLRGEIIFGDWSDYIAHRALHPRNFPSLLTLAEEYLQQGWNIRHITCTVWGIRIPLPLWALTLLLTLRRFARRDN